VSVSWNTLTTDTDISDGNDNRDCTGRNIYSHRHHSTSCSSVMIKAVNVELPTVLLISDFSRSSTVSAWTEWFPLDIMILFSCLKSRFASLAVEKDFYSDVHLKHGSSPGFVHGRIGRNSCHITRDNVLHLHAKICHIFVCCYTHEHMFSKTTYLQCSKDDALLSMQASREVLVDCDSCRGYILLNWV
jgi:hypothetical protein